MDFRKTQLSAEALAKITGVPAPRGAPAAAPKSAPAPKAAASNATASRGTPSLTAEQLAVATGVPVPKTTPAAPPATPPAVPPAPSAAPARAGTADDPLNQPILSRDEIAATTGVPVPRGRPANNPANNKLPGGDAPRGTSPRRVSPRRVSPRRTGSHNRSPRRRGFVHKKPEFRRYGDPNYRIPLPSSASPLIHGSAKSSANPPPGASQGEPGNAATGGSQGQPGSAAAGGSQAPSGNAAAGGSQGAPGSAAAGGGQGQPGSAAAGGGQGQPGSAAAGGSQGQPGNAAAGGNQGPKGKAPAGPGQKPKPPGRSLWRATTGWLHWTTLRILYSPLGNWVTLEVADIAAWYSRLGNKRPSAVAQPMIQAGGALSSIASWLYDAVLLVLADACLVLVLLLDTGLGLASLLLGLLPARHVLFFGAVILGVRIPRALWLDDGAGAQCWQAVGAALAYGTWVLWLTNRYLSEPQAWTPQLAVPRRVPDLWNSALFWNVVAIAIIIWAEVAGVTAPFLLTLNNY